MKKLLMIAATTTALLTSTSFANMENTFYAKANVGGLLLTKTTDRTTKLKMKSKTAMFAGVGVGYYLMDNLRTDLVYDHFFNPELKKSANGASIKHKANIDTLVLNGYIDAFDVSVVNIFLGGGLGVAMVKNKITYGNTAGGLSFGSSSKTATSMTYSLTGGFSAELTPGVKSEVFYSYQDFGKTKSKNGVNANGTTFSTGKTHFKGHNIGLGFRLDM